jgi:hypothetical protein
MPRDRSATVCLRRSAGLVLVVSAMLGSATAQAHTRCNYNGQGNETWWISFYDHDDAEVQGTLFHSQARREVRLNVTSNNMYYSYQTKLEVLCAMPADANCGNGCSPPAIQLEREAFYSDVDSADISVVCPEDFPRITEVAAWLDGSAWGFEELEQAFYDQAECADLMSDGRDCSDSCDDQGSHTGSGPTVPLTWWF